MSETIVMDYNEMRQPLLSDNQCENCEFQWSELWGEARKQLVIALPMIVMSLLQKILPMVSLMFVGHLSELALSSTSVALSITNVTGASIMLGMSCALETLCGQAFGAKQYHSIGVHMHRAILVLLCLCIPISILWFYMDHILVILGQDLSIACEAGKYTKYLIPTIFSYAFLYPMSKFLQSQSITTPMMVYSAIALTVHMFFCWFLIIRLGFGVEGGALANNISCWINVILLALYIFLSPACKRTRASVSREALIDIKNFLSIGIPSAVMTCCEWWAFEILVLLSGRLCNPQLETSILSICLNTAAVAYMIPCGFGAAVSTRISNELGSCHTRGVKVALRTGLLIAITEGLTMGVLMMSVKNYWGSIYSNEEEVISSITSMMPILAVGTILDGIVGVLSGIARGCGQQKLCAYANLVAYYVVGIPSASAMAFIAHLAAKGLWLGIVCGLFSQGIMLFLIMTCTDWNDQANKARERVYYSALPKG